ncbi:Chaperone protein fimC precursor [Providencia rustigianii]|nr:MULTISPECIES: molecular chaperone [Providencia]SUC28163.1 Chaperone protein fimC precursor [Providencia rustigianii]SUC36520.1 Chaperone protein fimC precursor [Providencia rustigianii]VEB74120.1 Chaperone protein fimC precursor [Providencia rustigianii]VEH56323.1 Chaperone protein fimC precursor [Providencia rustigianii]
MRNIVNKTLIIFSLFYFIAINANASVVLGGTRVIYEGDKKEASITVRNDETSAFLVQSWVDNFDGSNQSKPPFTVTPPLFRIEPESANAIRIVLTDPRLPADRESVYWLNVKSIPPSDPNATNSLTISINNKIKLIYRPSALPSSEATDAYEKLSFEKQGSLLKAKNPTPYYVSFGKLVVDSKEFDNPGMVPPMGEASWNISGMQAGKVTWNSVNDYGSMTKSKTQPLK